MILDPALFPPKTIPVVEFDVVEHLELFCVKSPKSVAFPVEAIVIYCITLSTVPVSPPAKTPLVPLDAPPLKFSLAPSKSPKSVALPSLAIVM